MQEINSILPTVFQEEEFAPDGASLVVLDCSDPGGSDAGGSAAGSVCLSLLPVETVSCSVAGDSEAFSASSGFCGEAGTTGDAGSCG